jgi:protein SCO1/2
MMVSTRAFLLACLLVGCFQITGLTVAPFAAEARDESVLDQSSRQPGSTNRVILPTVSLVDQDNRAQRLDRLVEARTVVIGFVYTNCKTSCSILSAIMAQVEQRVRDRLGDHVVLVSLTVDPAHDTPAQLKAYAAKFAETPHWYWLTGSVADVQQALRAFNIPTFGKPEDHAPVIVAGNVRTGKWQRWIGIPDPDAVARAAQALSKE